MPKLSKAQLDRNKNAAKLRQKTAAEKRKSLETPAEPDNVTQRKRKSFGLNTGFRESSEDDSSECDDDRDDDCSYKDETSGSMSMTSK